MNALMQLKEYHDRSRVGTAPVYEFNQNLITKEFTATCLYHNKETHGVGPSKKDSQRIAAEEMLKRLNVMPVPFIQPAPRVPRVPPPTATPEVKTELTEEKKAKALRFLAEYGDPNSNSDARESMAPEQKIIDEVDMGLRSEDVPLSDTLALASQQEDAIDTFKQVMKEMKLTFSCKVPEIKHDAEIEHIVLILIHRRVHLMAGGMGFTVESATYAACKNAIAMLKVYTNL